jgi:hypothetical protein
MMRWFVCACILLAICSALAQAPSSLPQFPAPTKILQDDKQFNAVTFGPGNTFTVRQAPPDFQLDSFDFSSDGKLLFMEWASGRLEVRDLQSAKRVTQLKPMGGPVFEAEDVGIGGHLVVAGQHGLLRIVDLHSGKVLREIQTEVGKFKYDIQKVVVAQDGSWLAYINQEDGKVLDLKSDPPKVLAELEDAYDLALTPDKSELWLVNRERMFGLKLGTWAPIGTTPLLDKVQPTGTPTLAIAKSGDVAVAFIPSKSGLLRYDLKTLNGSKVTEKPTYWVASVASSNQILVNEFHAFSSYAVDGSPLCHWQQHPSQGFKVSGTGEWLGSRNFGKVELWSSNSLAGTCDREK